MLRLRISAGRRIDFSHSPRCLGNRSRRKIRSKFGAFTGERACKIIRGRALSDINGRPICISRLKRAKRYSALIPRRGGAHIYLSSFMTPRISGLSEILYLTVEFLAAISRAEKWAIARTEPRYRPMPDRRHSVSVTLSNAVCNYRCDSGKMIRDYLILLSWLCAVQGKIGKYPHVLRDFALPNSE